MQAEAEAEAIQKPRASVANPWLVVPWWVLATTVTGILCFPVAEGLGLPVVWGLTRATAGGLPETLVTGAIIGLAQGAVLAVYLRLRGVAKKGEGSAAILAASGFSIMRRMPPRWRRYADTLSMLFVTPRWRVLWMWPMATALGLFLGIVIWGGQFEVGPIPFTGITIGWTGLNRAVNSLNLHVVLGFAVSGAIEIVGVALCQWLVLMLHVRSAAWWLPATILAGASFWPVRNGLALWLGNSFQMLGDAQAYLSIAIAFIAYGAITGLTLALLLRRRRVTSDE